jgi:hypothetical protein
VDRVVVHAVGGERRQFEERRAWIDQLHHALARQQLAARRMTLARANRAAFCGFRAAACEFLGKRAHVRSVGAKFRRVRVDAGFDRQAIPLSRTIRSARA